MILVDHEIEVRCDSERYKNPLISPFKREHLQPASVDLTLDDLFMSFKKSSEAIDLANIQDVAYDVFYGSYLLYPQEFALGSTKEAVNLPAGLVGRVEGKSSLGRLGLLVHSTAGYIDPGFRGTITLEFFNLNNRPILLRPGLPVCQVSFTKTDQPARHPYGHKKLKSKYQHQQETTASRYAG